MKGVAQLQVNEFTSPFQYCIDKPTLSRVELRHHFRKVVFVNYSPNPSGDLEFELLRLTTYSL